MFKATEITDYLEVPETRKDKKLLQAYVSRKLKERASKVLQSKRLTWANVLEACLKKFCDEMEGK